MGRTLKFHVLSLSIFFAAFIFNGGCGKETIPQKKTILFWTLQLSPVFDDYIKNIISTFEKANPDIAVQWEDVPYDAVVQKLLAASAAGKAPDVVNLSADFLSKFTGFSLLLPLDELKPLHFYDSLFQQGALQDCRYGGRLYGLPWYLNTYTVLYNKNLLAAAGFSRGDIPATFTEAVQFIREYKRRTGKFAAFWNIGKDSYLPMMLGSEGIPMIDTAFTSPELLSPALVKLVGEWVQLYRGGFLPAETAVSSGASLIEPYQSGTVAFVMTGPVFLRRVRDNAPGVYANTEIAPPIVGVTGAHDLATMTLTVSRKTKYPRQALDFALYVTGPSRQLEFCKLATIYPSTKATLRDSFFTRGDEKLETRARIEGAKILPAAKRLSYFLRHPRYDELREAFEEAVQSACLEGTAVSDALRKAQSKWEAILKKR